jgi:hypothetical protein
LDQIVCLFYSVFDLLLHIRFILMLTTPTPCDIHSLSEVTCVVLTVSLADYNEPDPNGQFPNKMAAHIDIYSEIINSKWFRPSNLILLFTKIDLFRDKLQSSTQPKMKECWPLYEGSETDEAKIIRSCPFTLIPTSAQH